MKIDLAITSKLTVVMLLFVGYCSDLLALDVEKSELTSNLQASSKRIRELEDRLLQADKRLQVASTSLSSANTLATEAVAKYQALRETISSLGCEQLLTLERGSIQSDLLSALGELRTSNEKSLILRRAIEESLRMLSLENFDKTTVSVHLADAIVEKSQDDKISQVVSIKPEDGLLIVEMPTATSTQIGSSVSIGHNIESQLFGTVIDVRAGSACILIQQGIQLSSNVEVGSPVRFNASNKL